MEHATPAVIVMILAFILPVIFCIFKAKKGTNYEIRRIVGIDKVEEAVGRSVEMGRPISFTTGLTGLSPLLYACMGILRHVVGKVAKFGTPLIISSGDPETIALIDSTTQRAYRDSKKSSSYDPAYIRFLSSEQFAFASGYIGLIERENVGATFIFGSYAAESLILASAGQRVGAMQIAGTTAPEQVPFFVTTCDYTVIGEELYAAGAYLTKDPVQVGSLRASDIAKLFLILIIILGIFEMTLRSYSGEKSAIKKVIMKEW